MEETRALLLEDSGSVQGRGFLELVNGKLEAPDNIIMTVGAARSYYNIFRDSHIPRIKLMAAIEGLIAGNPPFPPEKLAALGLSHKANVNTLDAKAMYERVALTFWNLVNQTENYVVFELHELSDLGQDHDYTGWAQILARNWTKAVKCKWRSFKKQLNILSGQLVKFGVSPAVWSDERDCRWSTVDLNHFFIPDKTSVDSSEWDCICFETTFTVQRLYAIYLDEKEKEETNWDIDELERFLLRKANLFSKGGANQFGDMLDMQRAIQNKSYNFANTFSDTVQLVSLLYKEFSGKISHFMFDPAGEAQDFMMKLSDQYESFEEALVIFTYNPGEREIYSNRGVGHKIYPVCQIMMHLDNSMVDMSSMASTPIIRSNSTPGRSLEAIRFIPSVATDIGQAELEPNNLGANLPGLVEVAQYYEAKVNRNAIIGGDDPGMPDQDRGSKSAPEVQMQSIKEFGIGKQNVAHFYDAMDVVVEQMTIKMLHCKEGYPSYELCKYWKDMCLRDGVPEEVFSIPNDISKNEMPYHLTVRAARVAGDGSNLGLIMGLSGLQGIAGGFSEKGQYNYRKDLITARLGDDYVERYIEDAEASAQTGDDLSVAHMENLFMRSGEMPQSAKDNPHKIHIGSHMAFVTDIIKKVQAQQVDPVEADKQLSVAIPHLGEHINFLTEDSLNQAFVKQITGPWREVQKFALLNRVRAQKIMQGEIRRRAQEEQQLNADMMEQQRKDQVAEREQSRKDFESQKKQDRAKEQSDTKAEIMKRGVELKGENERLEVQLKHEAQTQIKSPQELLADRSTEDLQKTLADQVGTSPNPADFR